MFDALFYGFVGSLVLVFCAVAALVPAILGLRFLAALVRRKREAPIEEPCEPRNPGMQE